LFLVVLSLFFMICHTESFYETWSDPIIIDDYLFVNPSGLSRDSFKES
jgi:hypothetical protein